MKKFVFKFILFSAPFILLAAYITYEILVLPVDYFTFRAWEALKVYKNSPLLSGPFYPDIYLKKNETGDLAGLSKVPVVKEVEWYTDSYGYRKKTDSNKVFEIVVVGDSAIAGSALTQGDMFTENLGTKIKVRAYPFAPTNFLKFLDDERFRQNPPDIVIFESVEKLVLGISEIPNESDIRQNRDIAKEITRILNLNNTNAKKLAVVIDRLKKDTFVNYIYARIEELPKKLINGELKIVSAPRINATNIPTGIPYMVFYSEPEEYFKSWKQNHIDRVVKTLLSYQEVLTVNNTKLVFMPIPNKENIYWRKVQGGVESDNLKRLIEAVRESGIITVDLDTLYKLEVKNYPEKLIYHLDDTHWNPYGVDLAVKEAIVELKDNGLISK